MSDASGKLGYEAGFRAGVISYATPGLALSHEARSHKEETSRLGSYGVPNLDLYSIELKKALIISL